MFVAAKCNELAALCNNIAFRLQEVCIICNVCFCKRMYFCIRFMKQQMDIANLTPQEIFLGLLAVVGIAIFFVACWRNIKRHDDNGN